MSRKSVKDVRADLKRWGNFWKNKEYEGGYASTSTTARICETLRTGCYIQGTAHQVSHLADNMPTPLYIVELTEAIDLLDENKRILIVRKYIKKKPVKEPVLLRLLLDACLLYTSDAADE